MARVFVVCVGVKRETRKASKRGREGKFVRGDALKLTRTVFLVRLSIIGQRRSSLSLRLLLLHAALRRIQIQPAVLHTLVNFPRGLQESFFHILPRHRACFGEHQPVLVGELLRFLVGDLARRLKIALVADQEYHSRWVC